jgi:serine/threonine protein kinase
MLDENGKAKYADFGESKLLPNNDDNMDDQKGTELFLAPECLGSFK